jgi:predicted membrane channel-forming protein YqfA (hemolysin III family)
MSYFNVKRGKGKDSHRISRNLRKGTQYTLILSAFLTLYSCSAYYHTKQAKKHAQKAINKGATVTSDTTFIVTSDTLTEIDTVDNYIRITKTIRDTVKADCKTVYIAKSRTEVRQEQKTERTQIRQEEKTQRTEVKQVQKTTRKAHRKEGRTNWKFWIGLIIGFAAYFVLNRLRI